jgi:hypothetical protein
MKAARTAVWMIIAAETIPKNRRPAFAGRKDCTIHAKITIV